MAWKAFYLKDRSGNNEFSYDLRGENPSLWIPPLCEGGLDLVRPGDQVVFADQDEHEDLRFCTGLACELKTDILGVPAVVVDNHNFVFYFWAEALEQGLFSPGAILLHVDQHKDSRTPPAPYTGDTLSDAFLYTHHVVNVGNYIQPALERGWFSQVVNVTGEFELNQRVEGDFVLNLDLDFFAPELDYISFQKARAFLRDHAQRAKLVTIATSPFFIDQERAIAKLRAIFDVPCGENPHGGHEQREE